MGIRQSDGRDPATADAHTMRDALTKQLAKEDDQNTRQQQRTVAIESAHHGETHAFGLQLKTEQPEREQQRHHAGQQGTFEMTHTFSTSGRPRIPVGLNNRMASSKPNATTSLYSELR